MKTYSSAPEHRITTVLPPGGLNGYSNAINNLSLTLDASQNIVDNGAIASAGDLTALAGGMFSNQAVVSTSGAGAGGDADDITIIADSIVVNAPLLAVGGNGANGKDATQPGTFRSRRTKRRQWRHDYP